MKWITRKDIKVDRVACPWLIRRFVDPQAEFLFVEEKDLLEQAKQGFAALGLSDQDRLAQQFPVYDALYAYVQTLGK
jgi:hypothetical protein